MTNLAVPEWLAEQRRRQRARAEERRDEYRAEHPDWADEIEDADWTPPECPMCGHTLSTARLLSGIRELDCEVCEVRWDLVDVTAVDGRVIQ